MRVGVGKKGLSEVLDAPAVVESGNTTLVRLVTPVPVAEVVGFVVEVGPAPAFVVRWTDVEADGDTGDDVGSETCLAAYGGACRG